MKKVLFTLVSLLIATSALADCSLYIDDFTVSSEEIANGNAIELTVKAHFSARVGGWEINLVFPEGMYPVNCEGGIDTIIRYYNSNGKPRTADATISSYDNYTRIMGFSTTTTLGYWQDPNGDDPTEWVPYGPIQWEGGDYDEMMILYVEVDQNFQGGDIIMNSTFSAFPDTRGGTIKENGDSGVLFTHVCHVSADYGINVGGIAVTGNNVAIITGTSITGGTVSFNPATHVLTLTDATIACNTAPGIQVTTNYGFDDLTIRLVGNNNININSYTPVALRCQTTITGPGSLTVKLNGYNGNISMIGGHQLMIDGGCTIYSSDIDGSNSAATLKVRGSDTEINLSSCIHGFGSVTLEDGLGYVKPEGGSYDTNIRYTVDSYGDKWTNGVIIRILPYACYTEDNTTLTFYCDSKRNSRPGAKFNLNEGDDMPKWYNDGYFEDITKVVFDPSFAIARPTSTYCWFNEMYNLTSIEGIDYLNTSEVTNMAYMFSYCESLPSLDLSSFDTHHVTNMCYMFSYCSELQTVYVGDEWSTAAVTNSSGMFQGCTSIIGGMGTTYDANHVNKAYAHIDGGTSNPGYFTAKANFLRGDVNGDNQVNISDAIVLINYISNGNGNINLDAANVNNDNQVNITDAIMLINFISNGHW